MKARFHQACHAMDALAAFEYLHIYLEIEPKNFAKEIRKAVASSGM
jgi:hypothetical protein